MATTQQRPSASPQQPRLSSSYQLPDGEKVPVLFRMQNLQRRATRSAELADMTEPSSPPVESASSSAPAVAVVAPAVAATAAPPQIGPSWMRRNAYRVTVLVLLVVVAVQAVKRSGQLETPQADSVATITAPSLAPSPAASPAMAEAPTTVAIELGPTAVVSNETPSASDKLSVDASASAASPAAATPAATVDSLVASPTLASPTAPSSPPAALVAADGSADSPNPSVVAAHKPAAVPELLAESSPATTEPWQAAESETGGDAAVAIANEIPVGQLQPASQSAVDPTASPSSNWRPASTTTATTSSPASNRYEAVSSVAVSQITRTPDSPEKAIDEMMKLYRELYQQPQGATAQTVAGPATPPAAQLTSSAAVQSPSPYAAGPSAAYQPSQSASAIAPTARPDAYQPIQPAGQANAPAFGTPGLLPPANPSNLLGPSSPLGSSFPNTTGPAVTPVATRSYQPISPSLQSPAAAIGPTQLHSQPDMGAAAGVIAGSAPAAAPRPTYKPLYGNFESPSMPGQ